MLGHDFSKLPVVNLNAIAKDSDENEILLICKLVLYIAVTCPGCEKYIKVIQTQLLPQQQELMMFSIDQVSHTALMKICLSSLLMHRPTFFVCLGDEAFTK
jgi:hypothetical protein